MYIVTLTVKPESMKTSDSKKIKTLDFEKSENYRLWNFEKSRLWKEVKTSDLKTMKNLRLWKNEKPWTTLDSEKPQTTLSNVFQSLR